MLNNSKKRIIFWFSFVDIFTKSFQLNMASQKPESRKRKLDVTTETEDGGKFNKMMKKMGWKGPGHGLGKNQQGIAEPIIAQNKVDKGALGRDTEMQELANKYQVNSESEEKPVEETPTWLVCDLMRRTQIEEQLTEEWIVLGKPKELLDDEDRFCSRELIADLLTAKTMFDTVDRKDLNAARARANPYETIKAGFFQNRAAMKTANLDKIYGWRLSREFEDSSRLSKNPLEEGKIRQNVDRSRPLFYFADVCAGPGGFSEYMLWRKAFYNAKGFGFTLAGRDDFKLHQFKAASPEYFEPFYGVNDDGDVMAPENLESLEHFVRERIHGTEKGVHLVMCDGGFSVEGKENIQEILSKRLYLCQFIAGLSLCRVEAENRRGGNFLCKLFDVFTPFSMGLIYLMYISFDKISIHKPITSRPANSERYIFCENLKQFGANQVKKFLVAVNNRLDKMNPKLEDVRELVPAKLIEADQNFMDYMRGSNEEIAQRQIYYLIKYWNFAKAAGNYDQDQATLRDKALQYWELPDHIERPIDTRDWRNQHRHDPNNRPQQQREPAATTLQRLAGNHPLYPVRTRLARFTAKVPQDCADINELRAQFCMEKEPELLISQGHGKLFAIRRSGERVEPINDLDCSLPKDTILLVQATTLFGLASDGKMQSVGKCLWVLDGAVLNGEDISHLELRERLNACRKFANSINKRHMRRPIWEQIKERGNRQSTITGHKNERFSELIVADAMHLEALCQQKFEITQAKMAFFPKWAGDDPREQPPNRHFLMCRGIRVLNRLNPNFMLTYSQCPKTGKELEGVVPRKEAQFFNQQRPHPHSTFYESMIGSVPKEQWISTFPMGHPHNGAITFHWSWEQDYNAKYSVENILKDSEHSAGLTMKHLHRIIQQKQIKKEEPKEKVEEEDSSDDESI